VRYSSIGKSFEGRDIPALRVGGKAGAPVMYIQGTMHAREWIATSSAMFLAHQLMTSDQPRIKAMVAKFHWVIVPVVNPDGYEFSRLPGNRWVMHRVFSRPGQTATYEMHVPILPTLPVLRCGRLFRLWRKNRNTNSAVESVDGRSCAGVDMNRNWGNSWHLGDNPSTQSSMHGDGREGSDDTCTEVYRGASSFSESETQAVRDFFTDMKADGYKPKTCIDLHSFSQTIMYPYGFAKSDPPNAANLKRCGARPHVCPNCCTRLSWQHHSGMGKTWPSHSTRPHFRVRSHAHPAGERMKAKITHEQLSYNGDQRGNHHPLLTNADYRSFQSSGLYPAFGEMTDWCFDNGVDKQYAYTIELPDGPVRSLPQPASHM
jgi:predicted deacylase